MASFITIAFCAFFSVCVFYNISVVYDLYHPKPCSLKDVCLHPSWNENSKFQLFACTSTRGKFKTSNDLLSLTSLQSFDVFSSLDVNLQVKLPYSTRHNGSLYLHVFITRKNGEFKDISDVIHDLEMTSHGVVSLTKYMVPKTKFVNLLDGKNESKKPITDKKPMTHWKSRISVHVMSEVFSISLGDISKEVSSYLRINNKNEYLPLVYVNDLSTTANDLLLVNSSNTHMPLQFTFLPVNFGKFRMMTIMQHSLKTLEKLGFKDRDTDEVKSLMFNTNVLLLLGTFFIAALHFLLDMLAFKSDISFWMKKKTMTGLSMNTLIWRCGSQIVIFFYLFDQETSLLILIPSALAMFVEVWKIMKASKLKVYIKSWRLKFEFGAISEEEKVTSAYDSQIMKYLYYLLYPLCISCAVYSLLYVQHKSWFSWCIQSLANGVYAFGFIFMLPQLFVNYKLKSVAHLSFTAFVYKAINTFIDDLFAFITIMPTSHRVACFRDDVVFLVYLYQRWLYKVDKTRPSDGKKKED